MARREKRAILWFAGIVIFVLLAGALTTLVASVSSGAGLTLSSFTGGLVILFAIAAAFCAYRLGQRWWQFHTL